MSIWEEASGIPWGRDELNSGSVAFAVDGGVCPGIDGGASIWLAANRSRSSPVVNGLFDDSDDITTTDHAILCSTGN
jgi:hypothetical protein